MYFKVKLLKLTKTFNYKDHFLKVYLSVFRNSHKNVSLWVT